MVTLKEKFYSFWFGLSDLAKIAYITAISYFLIGPLGVIIDTALIVFAPALAQLDMTLFAFESWVTLQIVALGLSLLAKRWVLFLVTLISLIPLLSLMIGMSYVFGYLLETWLGINIGQYR